MPADAACEEIADILYGEAPPVIDTDPELPEARIILVGLTANGAVTLTLIAAVKPFLSVTVTEAVPLATPVIVTVLPITDAVATPAFEDDTV